jgi:hypothetical protein
MLKYFAYVPWETHRFLRPRNLVILSVLLAALLVIVNPGVNKYLALEEKSAIFKDYQETQFKHIPDYSHYSVYGIRLLFIPAPISILFDNTILPPDLSARVNSLIALEISSNLKGKFLARGFFIGAVNFAFILFTIVSLLVLLYGRETFHTREYQRFLFSFRLNWKVIFAIGITRFLLFSAGTAVISGLVLLFINTRGVSFTAADYKGFLAFFLAAEVVFLFFFILGLLFSFIRPLKLSLSLLFGSWIVFTIIIPGFLLSRVEDKFPDAIKDLEASLKKLEIQLDFEKRSKKEHGEFDRKRLDLFSMLAEKYWAEDFPRMVEEEKGVMARLEESVTEMQRLYLLTPTTFYLLTWSEVSSTGYRGFFEFYRYVLDMMIKFSRFWIDRVFYHDVHRLVNFIKGNEDLFVSRSRPPRFFWQGIILHLGTALVLAVLSYFFLLRFLFPKPKKTRAFDDIVIDFKPGKSYKILCFFPGFYEQLIKKFFAKTLNLKWKISLDGKEIAAWAVNGIRYLPDPRYLPEEIKGIHLLNLIKRLFNVPLAEINHVKEVLGEQVLKTYFKKLDIEVKIRIIVMTAALTRGSIYIIKDLIDSTIPGQYKEPVDDENKEKEDNELFYIQETLQGKDVVLIDISKDRCPLTPDKMLGIHFKKGKYYIIEYKNVNEKFACS